MSVLFNLTIDSCILHVNFFSISFSAFNTCTFCHEWMCESTYKIDGDNDDMLNTPRYDIRYTIHDTRYTIHDTRYTKTMTITNDAHLRPMAN